jgi:hypothetical protein
MYDWEVMARSRVLHKELLDLVAADQNASNKKFPCCLV